MRKIHGAITAASTDTEIKKKPNAPRSLATEILTHRKFVKLQYSILPSMTDQLTNSVDEQTRCYST